MKLTLQQLEAHLWGAANILRGKTAGQDYKNYILSLMFTWHPSRLASVSVRSACT